MSKKWAVGTALAAAAASAVVFATCVTGGTALAAAPENPAATTPKATTTPKVTTSPARKSTAAAVAPTTSTPTTPVVSAATAKKLAAAAAQVITPAIVDILATDATSGAAGTGIVLTSTGEVLTNYHVITGATRITATDIGTGRTYRATVVGYDAADDVAVLQLVGAAGLATAQLETTTAALGQTVVAVGNAEGLGGTPSWVSGTVTDDDRAVVATDEDGNSPETLSGMLQTTTPIVPGYSGGPLVDTAGVVVGMDTSGSFASLSKPATAAYAIPIAKALAIVAEIVAGQASATITIG